MPPFIKALYDDGPDFVVSVKIGSDYIGDGNFQTFELLNPEPPKPLRH